MAAHGAQKALGWFAGPGPQKAAQMLDGLGFRPGTTYAPLAAWTEIAGGVAIVTGLGGPVGPSMVISTMTVAQASVHWKNGFFAQKGGIELGVLYASAALAFAATDYGAVSFDAALGLRGKLRDPLFTTLALAGGIASALIVLNNRDLTQEGPATPTFRGKNSPLPEEQTAAA